MKDRETYKTIGEQTLNALMEVTHESLVLLDIEGTVLLSNTVAAQRLGKTPSEIIGTCLWDHFSPDVAKKRKEKFDTVILTGRPIHCEDVRAGRFFEMYYYPVIDDGGDISGGAIFAHDITDRKQAEEILQKSEEKYRNLFYNAAEGVYQSSPDGRLITANPAFAKILGFDSPDEAIASLTDVKYQVYANPEDRETSRQMVEKHGSVVGLETQFYRKDGSKIWVRYSMRGVRDENGIIQFYEGIVDDITPGKLAQEQLIKLTHDLNENIKELNFLYTASNLIQQEDIAMEDLLQEMVDKIPSAYQYPEITCARIRLHDYDFKTKNFKESPWKQTSVIRMPGNEIGSLEVYYTEDKPICDEGPFLKGERTVINIISERLGKVIERIQAEKALSESEEKYRSIFDNAVEGIFQTTLGGRFLSANPALARMFGYDSPEDLIKGITDLATQGYVDPEDRVRYKKILEEQGTLESFETQHRRKDGGTLWILINARLVRDEAGKVLYYEGTIEDITSRKLAEEKLKQTLEKLRKSLAGTIQAMSLTVETRDPYTAGHQRRVSNLARAIAQEMGLSSDTVDNIRMGGIIHDIGKISIPAELLAKPTRLTSIEMSLIKVHPQSGYDILKDVDLPYPIAEMVLQHHERLDGSGYPQGLKSDQILLEAKILSVADVTEAIATHRPYRPALGIDAALEEIEKNKGILYDETAAEVCIKLFREGKFTFD